MGRFFISMAMPYLLNAVFLGLLTYKLEYKTSVPWYAVFVPFWGADLLTGAQKARDICSSDIDDPVSDSRAVKAAVQLIECLGQAATKLAVFLYLAGLSALHQRFTLMVAPLILSTFIAMYLRCTRTNDSDFSILLGTTYHFVARVLQPLLVACALDGFIDQPLMVVMTPAWTVLIIFFSGALFLAYCAPVIRLHALQQLQSQAMLLVLMCCAYLLSISCCGFLFIFFLAQKLDIEAGYSSAKGLDISTLQVVIPLIVLQFILAVIQPGITIVSRRFQTMTQMYMNMQGGSDNVLLRRPWLRPVRQKTWLCRSRGTGSDTAPTHIYRSTEAVFERLGYQKHEDLLLAIIECSSDGTKLLPWRRFVHVSSESSTESDYLVGTLESDRRTASLHASIEGNSASSADVEATTPPEQARALLENEEESDQDNCIICYCQVADACIMTCGHGGICYSCASALASKASRSCPICRQPIQRVLHLNPSFFWLQRGVVGVFSSEEGLEVCYQNPPAAATGTRNTSSSQPSRRTHLPFPRQHHQHQAALDAEIEAAVISSAELDPPL
jgi:hypothetical protein